jgi:DNA polymerase
MPDIANDIKAVLEFYQALGFERLPIGSNELRVTSNKFKDKEKNSSLSSGSSLVTRHSLLDKQAALDALRAEIGDCRMCKLFKGRKNLVFGEGSPDADLMFIGEGPGREEDLQGRPFVGEAGQLLTKLIEKMGFKREDVYIGNIVKCRPPLNRDPEEDEINTCLSFIEKQVEIISPKVIMSLGRISSHALTGTNIPITKLRGHFYEYKGIPLMPTFHPAYLLRNRSDKILTWNDALKVLEKLGI